MCEDNRLQDQAVNSQYVDVAADVFTLLSDPTRIRIILALSDCELSVGDLATQVDKAPTAVSQHLAKLRWGKVVHTRQEGTRVFYSLTDEHARQLVTQALLQAEHMVEFNPPHHRNANATSATTFERTHR